MNMKTAQDEYELPARAETAFVTDPREWPTTPEPYVSATAVAKHLNVKPRQVLELTRAGKLPAHSIDPTAARKQWRYKLSEIDTAVHQPSSRPYNEARQPRDRKGR